ncbi:MAG: hypothetical protein B0D92_05075 [Spirochaeta sp. LUC14_002_19_P3]|nr:MAG: hypothetical protein B0D92_05075 [Spirochaeta sp. LUC14_002_19_P3]
MKKFIFICLFMLTFLAAVYAQSPAEVIHSQQHNFILRPIAVGLSRPWGLAFLPDGGMLLTERTGSLLLIKNDKRYRVSGLPKAAVIGQGGLLDVALAPDYSSSSLIYLTFAEEENSLYGTAAARGQLTGTDSSRPKLQNVEIIYRVSPKSAGGLHFGSRLAFDRQGLLYISLGERGTMQRAQNPLDPGGSIVRINPNGSIPPDNPFAPGSSGAGKGAPEVWSYGTRNSQGMAMHPNTGEIWFHEHGPKGGDEVNIARKGANFGWPRTTYGINYNGTIISRQTTAPGITPPIIYWVPSIAPSGLAFYTGSRFKNWQGNAFVGALAGQHLRRLVLQGNTVRHQEVLLKDKIGRIRDVRTGPDGYIYLLTDANKGILYRLEPAD